MRHFLLVGLLLAGCGSGEPERPLPAGSDRAPDIVLISIDTLRPDHLGLYGHDRDTSPFLDEMAARGTVFEQAWSPAPWTLPAHATMFSGLRPDHHGAIEETLAISEEVPLLTEALEAVGYRRGGFVTTPFVGARYGFDRGFDDFEELVPDPFTLAAVVDADSVAERVLDWAEELPEGVPAFALVHLYDAHYPCDPPEPWNTKFGRPALPEELHYENYFYYLARPLDEDRLVQERSQYDEEIAFVDEVLRGLCTTWAASRPNTVFVVVSDHGEEFGERGSWGHGHTLTPEQLRVPWIVWGAGISRGRVAGRVGLEDLAPTLASLAGTRFGPFDGTDRTPELQGRASGPPTAALASTSRGSTTKIRIHEGPFDLIADLRQRQVQVYDLHQDPRATTNVGPENADRVVQLWTRMVGEVGLPWRARETVVAWTDGVVILEDGNLGTDRVDLAAGARFALWPLDATLAVEGGGQWQILGGTRPGEGDPVSWQGEVADARVLELSEEEKLRLRSLGYGN